MTNQNPTQNYEAAIFNQLVKVSEENAVIKYKIELVEQQVAQIPEIKQQVKKLDERLGNIEAQTSNLDERLGNIEAQTSNLDERLGNIEAIPETIKTTIKSGTRWIIITLIAGIAINIVSTPIIANLFNH